MKFIGMPWQNWSSRSTPDVYATGRYDSLVAQDTILRPKGPGGFVVALL
jgi:hypothetical protein